MTVKELLEKLQTIENKDLEVFYYDWFSAREYNEDSYQKIEKVELNIPDFEGTPFPVVLI